MILLRPLSWLYALVMAVRNWCFDHGVLLHAEAFDVATIVVGNLAVGGTGKTPHAELLLRLLAPRYRTAFLSRGYGRKTRGYVLIDNTKAAADVGDEPLQVHRKFPAVRAAVCEDRREGLRQLLATAPRPEVVVLDDAFQHRYVRAGLNILLTDYHRLYCDDHVLPEGRLRERAQGARRAQVIIVTKCPAALTVKEMTTIGRHLSPLPRQALFFTTFAYGRPYSLFPDEATGIENKRAQDDETGGDATNNGLFKGRDVLVLTGIAHPESLYSHVEQLGATVHPLRFADHHRFRPADVDRLNRAVATIREDALVLTTEKDAVRLVQVADRLSRSVRRRLFVQPVVVRFLENAAGRSPFPKTEEKRFNQIITDYVTDLSTSHKANS